MLLGVVVFATHWRPALAWPLQGVWTALAVVGLALLAFLTGRRLGFRWAGAAAPTWALTLFTAWVWGRTATGINLAEGLLDVSSYLNGLLFFGLGVFVVRGGETQGQSSSRKQQKGLLAISGIFWALSVSIAVHGILEYHVFFPRQLAEQRASGIWNPANAVDGAILTALSEMRVRSLFGNPNVLCGFFAFTHPLLVAAAWQLGHEEKRSRLQRSLIVSAFGLSSLLIFYTAFRTGSVGGGFVFLFGLALIAGWGVYQAKRSPKSGFLLSVLTGFLWVFFCLTHPAAPQAFQPTPSPAPVSSPLTTESTSQTTATAIEQGRKTPFWKGLRQEHTIPQRLYYCRIGLRIWQDAPFLGHGLSGYQTLYLKYRRAGEGETRYAHNFMVQLLADTGLVGLGLFCGFLALLARRFWWGLRARPVASLWLASGAAVFLFLLDSLGEYTFCNRECYQDFALLAGAFCAASPDRRDLSSPLRPSGTFPQFLLPTLAFGLVGICFYASTLRPFMARYYLQNAENALKEMEWIERSEHRPSSTPENMSWEEWRQDALDSTDKALLWFPKSSDALQKRAALHSMARQEEKAEQDLLEACRLNPWSAALRAQLAECVWRQGRREEALELTEEAIARHPVKSPPYLQRARYLEALGRPDEARQCVEEAVRLAFMPQEITEAQRALRRIETRNR
jgi:hypothetical protein